MYEKSKEGKQSWTFNRSVNLSIYYLPTYLTSICLSFIIYLSIHQKMGIFQFLPC